MSTNAISRILLGSLFTASTLLLSTPLIAEETPQQRSSRSISYSNSLESKSSVKDAQLEQADIESMQALKVQGFRTESTVMAAHISVIEHVSTGEVSVYDVSTELISDFDHDGFFHRYSAVIDVDTIYDTSYIYVRLYLSYEGGPWNYYASSDLYHIHGDSENDAFAIETELVDGYPAGYYDVRIEVYDADNDEWLSSYGPYDDASLAALPLEDSYHDDIHSSISYPLQTEVLVVDHGGSMSWYLIPLTLLLLTARMLLSSRSKRFSGQAC